MSQGRGKSAMAVCMGTTTSSLTWEKLWRLPKRVYIWPPGYGRLALRGVGRAIAAQDWCSSIYLHAPLATPMTIAAT